MALAKGDAPSILVAVVGSMVAMVATMAPPVVVGPVVLLLVEVVTIHIGGPRAGTKWNGTSAPGGSIRTGFISRIRSGDAWIKSTLWNSAGWVVVSQLLTVHI